MTLSDPRQISILNKSDEIDNHLLNNLLEPLIVRYNADHLHAEHTVLRSGKRGIGPGEGAFSSLMELSTSALGCGRIDIPCYSMSIKSIDCEPKALARHVFNPQAHFKLGEDADNALGELGEFLYLGVEKPDRAYLPFIKRKANTPDFDTLPEGIVKDKISSFLRPSAVLTDTSWINIYVKRLGISAIFPAFMVDDVIIWARSITRSSPRYVVSTSAINWIAEASGMKIVVRPNKTTRMIPHDWTIYDI